MLIQYVGVITFLILNFLSALHIYWGLGGIWPGKNKQDLIDRVYGRGDKMPKFLECFIVALLLTFTSFLPILKFFTQSKYISTFSLNVIIIFIMFIFVVRGILGYLPIVERQMNPKFVRLNRIFYSPLCLYISFCLLIIALS